MASPRNDLGIEKKDLTVIEEQARADATAAGMDENSTQYHIRLAVDHARDYNSLFDALSTRAEAGSAPSQAAHNDRSHKEELRVSLQMPERYNGTTDFGAWLRRYENTANAAGWSSGTKAARLGMYLTDEFYEMWDQYAPKQTFEEDSRIMLQMLARRPADAILDNFHDLRWAPCDYAPSADLTSTSSPALQQVEAKLQKVLAAVTTSTPSPDPMLQQLTEKIQGLEKQLQGSGETLEQGDGPTVSPTECEEARPSSLSESAAPDIALFRPVARQAQLIDFKIKGLDVIFGKQVVGAVLPSDSAVNYPSFGLSSPTGDEEVEVWPAPGVQPDALLDDDIAMTLDYAVPDFYDEDTTFPTFDTSKPECVTQAASTYKATFDAKAKLRLFRPGLRVRLETLGPARSNKLDPRWEGNWFVSNALPGLDNKTLEVVHPDSGRRKIISVDHLLIDPIQPDHLPEDVARMVYGDEAGILGEAMIPDVNTNDESSQVFPPSILDNPVYAEWVHQDMATASEDPQAPVCPSVPPILRSECEANPSTPQDLVIRGEEREEVTVTVTENASQDDRNTSNGVPEIVDEQQEESSADDGGLSVDDGGLSVDDGGPSVADGGPSVDDDGHSSDDAGPSDDSDVMRSGSGINSSTSSSAVDEDSPEDNDVSSPSEAPEFESAHEETDNDDPTSEVPQEWNLARDRSRRQHRPVVRFDPSFLGPGGRKERNGNPE
ncbi:hypothetical protein FOZ60_000991 [Perkinsus olseni]|uniref:Uncharacterized protein n=1 Tax=Perkinsus olseni TaxID=32597 RepID=A0A7J6P1B8_PEROL|nr:hypothetical protein FOZ60_000991 [Perkinsus olseni]